MDKGNRSLPHVRQRDNLQEHQARLAVPYARDHSACPGSSPSHLADRFIPCRAREEDQSAFDDFRSPKRRALTRGQNLPSTAFSSLLACTLGLKTPPQDLQNPYTSKTWSPTPRKDKTRVLQFANPAALPLSPFESAPLPNCEATQYCTVPSKEHRQICSGPVKVLDAPSLTDDFYLNLLDWSQQGLLAVGLGARVYIYNTVTSKPFKLAAYPRDKIWPCSVAFSNSGALLSVGLSNGMVDVWDIEAARRVRRMSGHTARVCASCWSPHLLSTAGRDSVILQRDIRVPEDAVAALHGHRSEVCSLKWSPGRRELASGGNDNTAMIWSASTNQCRVKLTAHTASVKAIAWSPHQADLLATGGGTMDKSIAIWNANTGAMLQRTDTGSQVCGLAWSTSVNELISTHGFAVNTIQLWTAPSLTKTTTLSGHTRRVLFLAMSPCGTTAATGASDETVRFWKVFPDNSKPSLTAGLHGHARTLIR